MDSLIKADIFFFISSTATVILTILLSILFFYLIKAARNLRELSNLLKNSYNESEEFVTDLVDRFERNILFRFLFPKSSTKRKIKKDN
ncbi:MAG: hypothetical protein V4690_00470 [Patescibacteria group bacterium]